MSNKRIHNGPDGPGDCGATVGHCPYEHFETLEEATAAYARSQGGAIPAGVTRPSHTAATANSDNTSPVITYTGEVIPMAGGRYLGMEVPRDVMNHWLKRWEQVVGSDAADDMANAKANRDRGHHWHATVIGPPELKSLQKQGVDVSVPVDAKELHFKGIGVARDGDNEAWFLVAESPSLNAWRESKGLGHKDLHVTLGFTSKDIHGVPKDASTIVPGTDPNEDS